MEIGGLDSIAFEPELQEIEPTPKVPLGIGSTQDTLRVQPRAPKPPLLFRIAFSVCLILFETAIWIFRFTTTFLKSLIGLMSSPKHLYRELHHVALTQDEEKIRAFFIEHREDAVPAAFLFSEFVHLPELYSHLPEILRGANICLVGDQGFFCRRWSEHPECYKRLSSHNYEGDQCYAIDHLLFWRDPEGNTRFQFENSQWRGFVNSIHHIIDFLRYRRDNEQQGVAGTSPYTEDYSLKIEIDLMRFLSHN